MEGESDSDAPEEFTSRQGLEKEEEIRKIIRENKARVAREAKERRKRRAQKKPEPSSNLKVKSVVRETEIPDEPEAQPQPQHMSGMLPESIVNLLAAREKLVFPEVAEVTDDESMPKKKKKKKSGSKGLEPVILKDLPGPQCAQNSMEFLKKRKLAVSRSASSLRKPEQAFRYLAKSGMLGSS
ncbi:hypothetical protein EJ110_NYTH37419 [Nymphaea thermarum]|nr:hypothetical protein EJ110_NYTH37419 [Nymphaea thermarum]